jgi:hypothetical protein
MKRIFSRAIAMCGAALLTTLLSYGIANAQCADYVIPSSGGGWSCDLTGESGGYCYYSCDCGKLSAAECNERLHKAGFEIEGIDY